jgi:hypothetical protein
MTNQPCYTIHSTSTLLFLHVYRQISPEMTFNIEDVFDDNGIMCAQKTMGFGILIVPPHDFQHPSRWYCQGKEIKKCEFGVFSNSITSIQNSMKVCPAIHHY